MLLIKIVIGLLILLAIARLVSTYGRRKRVNNIYPFHADTNQSLSNDNFLTSAIVGGLLADTLNDDSGCYDDNPQDDPASFENGMDDDSTYSDHDNSFYSDNDGSY